MIFRSDAIPLLAALALGLLASPAVVRGDGTFTDRGAFTAAASTLTTQDFNSIIGTPGFPDNYPPAGSGAGTYTTASTGLTVAGVNYLGSGAAGYETYILAPSVGSGAFSLNGTAALVGGRTATYITLPTGTTAFGADFGLLSSSAGRLTFEITLTNGTVLTTALDVTQKSQFGGVIVSEGITAIHISTGSGAANAPYLLIDNVSIGATRSAVPEPSSFVLALTAAAGLLLASRQRSSRRPTASSC